MGLQWRMLGSDGAGRWVVGSSTATGKEAQGLPSRAVCTSASLPMRPVKAECISQSWSTYRNGAHSSITMHP